MRKHLLPILVWLFYRTLIATWRLKPVESPYVLQCKKQNKAWIIAHWHGDEIAAISFCRIYSVATMTSTSRDGELMNSVLNRLGIKTSRGSSTRGGAAGLKGLIRLTRTGACPVVAVDGPKGPIHEVKAGVFELAKISGLGIVPMVCKATSKFVFKKSWNQAYLPLPFSEVFMIWGEPIFVSKEMDPRSPALAQELKMRLDALA